MVYLVDPLILVNDFAPVTKMLWKLYSLPSPAEPTKTLKPHATLAVCHPTVGLCFSVFASRCVVSGVSFFFNCFRAREHPKNTFFCIDPTFSTFFFWIISKLQTIRRILLAPKPRTSANYTKKPPELRGYLGGIPGSFKPPPFGVSESRRFGGYNLPKRIQYHLLPGFSVSKLEVVSSYSDVMGVSRTINAQPYKSRGS